jgi:hypothetical protein
VTEERVPFVWSDAWLLLALLYAGGPADRRLLREIGDGINHAIFTDAELDGGLARLQDAGYAAGHDGTYVAAPIACEWFAASRPKHGTIGKDLERVTHFLEVSPRG